MSLSQATLRHEDGDDEAQLPPSGRKDRRRASVGGTNERRGLERRRSRRHSLQNNRGHASAPASPSNGHTSSVLPFGGQCVEDISERWDGGGGDLKEGKEVTAASKWHLNKCSCCQRRDGSGKLLETRDMSYLLFVSWPASFCECALSLNFTVASVLYMTNMGTIDTQKNHNWSFRQEAKCNLV